MCDFCPRTYRNTTHITHRNDGRITATIAWTGISPHPLSAASRLNSDCVVPKPASCFWRSTQSVLHSIQTVCCSKSWVESLAKMWNTMSCTVLFRSPTQRPRKAVGSLNVEFGGPAVPMIDYVPSPICCLLKTTRYSYLPIPNRPPATWLLRNVSDMFLPVTWPIRPIDATCWHILPPTGYANIENGSTCQCRRLRQTAPCKGTMHEKCDAVGCLNRLCYKKDDMMSSGLENLLNFRTDSVFLSSGVISVAFASRMARH